MPGENTVVGLLFVESRLALSALLVLMGGLGEVQCSSSASLPASAARLSQSDAFQAQCDRSNVVEAIVSAPTKLPGASLY